MTRIEKIDAEIQALEAQKRKLETRGCKHDWQEESDHIHHYRICRKCRAYQAYDPWKEKWGRTIY